MIGARATTRGGDKMAQVLAEIGSRAAGRVKVGYLEGATYPDGTSVAQVAAWQEFGTPGALFPIPPRPTFRIMIGKHKGEWGRELARVLRACGYDGRVALARMGERMKDELVESLLSANVAELSEVTKMLRKMRSDNPGIKMGLTAVFEAIRRVQAGESGATGTAAKRLIDHGVLLRAPAYEVET